MDQAEKMKMLDRIIELVDSKGVSAYEIANNIGLTEAGVGKILNRKSKNPRDNSLVQILNYVERRGESSREVAKPKESYPTNNSKNITVNDPLEFFSTKSGSTFEQLPDGTFRMTVPFVPVQAQASYVSENIDINFFERYKKQTFRVNQTGNGRYLAWQIKNDSMDDGTDEGLKDGDIILTRQLNRIHWKSKFRYTHFPFWVIVTKEDVICKEIINHNVEKGIITCHSLNSEYKDFDLSLNDVKEIYNVIPTLDE